MALLEFTENGIYCPIGRFHIDPWGRTDCAIITHAHSDHARWGQKHYISHIDSSPILKLRIGKDISLTTYPYGVSFFLNGVKISLHPAGHIIGSAQVRVEYKGEVWVASGDYKVENDGLSEPFEPVKCHTFISESTFGLPVYRWQPQQQLMADINNWWKRNAAEGKASVLIGYALGKAQRMLYHADVSTGPVYLHGAVANIHDALTEHGISLPAYKPVLAEKNKEAYRNALIIAPPSALGTPWLNRFEPYTEAIASGWMGLRGARRRRAVDKGIVLSDHADWPGLNAAITATGAEKVYLTHGYSAIFARWLREKGYDAHDVETQYEGETTEINETETAHE